MQIYNPLEKETQTEQLQAAIDRYGKPEIINSDQGSQYTSAHWISFLQEARIRISMDGKGRATDNAFIERWFSSLKHRHVYLHQAKNGPDLYEGINRFVKEYNRRAHQKIASQKPQDLYLKAA